MCKFFTLAFISAVLIAGASCGTPTVSRPPLCPLVATAVSKLSEGTKQSLRQNLEFMHDFDYPIEVIHGQVAGFFQDIYDNLDPFVDYAVAQSLVDVSYLDSSYSGVYGSSLEWIPMCYGNIREALGMA